MCKFADSSYHVSLPSFVFAPACQCFASSMDSLYIDSRVVLIYKEKYFLVRFYLVYPPIGCSLPRNLFLQNSVGIRIYLGYAQRMSLLVNG